VAKKCDMPHHVQEENNFHVYNDCIIFCSGPIHHAWQTTDPIFLKSFIHGKILLYFLNGSTGTSFRSHMVIIFEAASTQVNHCSSMSWCMKDVRLNYNNVKLLGQNTLSTIVFICTHHNVLMWISTSVAQIIESVIGKTI